MTVYKDDSLAVEFGEPPRNKFNLFPRVDGSYQLRMQIWYSDDTLWEMAKWLNEHAEYVNSSNDPHEIIYVMSAELAGEFSLRFLS